MLPTTLTFAPYNPLHQSILLTIKLKQLTPLTLIHSDTELRLEHRDLVLTHPSSIALYLDERFPSPSLLHGDPIDRARIAELALRLKKQWYPLISDTTTSPAAFIEALHSLSHLFSSFPYFLNQKLSYLDLLLAPLLNALLLSDPTLPLHPSIKNYYDRLNRHTPISDTLSSLPPCWTPTPALSVA